MTRIGTYNLWAYGKYKSEVDRHRLVVSVVKTLGDVLLVQELYGGDDGQAGATLRQLADATGMRCEIAPGAYAAVAGGRLEASLGLGILWRDGIEPVPGTWRTVSEGRLCHGGELPRRAVRRGAHARTGRARGLSGALARGRGDPGGVLRLAARARRSAVAFVRRP
jgi:hypothetical protein